MCAASEVRRTHRRDAGRFAAAFLHADLLEEAFGAAAAGIRHTATAMLFICCAAILLSVLIMEAQSCSFVKMCNMNGLREIEASRCHRIKQSI